MKNNNMETEPMNKLAFKISIPMVISMISIALYGIIDTMFISKSSDKALTASVITLPIQSIITAVALGVGIGVNTFLAKTLGEKNEDKSKKIMQNGIVLSFISWIVIAILVFFFAEKFISYFTIDKTILQYGVTYLKITGIISIGIIYQILFEKILEAYGKSKSSMIVQFSGAIINLILDPILIFGYFGIPELGIKGAAISTVIGQCFGMFVGVIIIVKNKILRLKELIEFKLDKLICKRIYKVGFPTSIREAVGSFITVFLNKVLSGFSDDAVAVWGLYSQLQKFVMIIVYGFNYGMIPILAYNYGAKNKKRIEECMKVFIKIGVAVTAIGMFAFIAFTRNLINIYDVTEEVIEIAVPAFRILALGFVFAGISLVISASFQAFGNGTYSLIVNLSRQIIFVVPLLFIFKIFFGIYGIWIAFVLAEVITTVLSYYLHKRMKKHLNKEL